MKLNLEIDAIDLDGVDVEDIISFYNDLNYTQISNFLDFMAGSSEKMELLEKILENCSDKEKEEIKKLLED
ncbi:TPA: hypothetical protein RZK34_001026 [Campylobacter jejuni]|nr:hypothetical protein [Campylobacter jejuni]HEB9329971.1 hypothetical protein [Campylobacter jejuni]